jgi:hypothetical protein
VSWTVGSSPRRTVDGGELNKRDKSGDGLDNGLPSVKLGSRRDCGPRGSL